MQTLAELEQSERAASTVEFAQRAKVSRSASDESLLTRLELAHQKIRDLTQENRELRNRIAHTLGDLRTARLGIRIDENHKSH
jgi:hypothetical protein